MFCLETTLCYLVPKIGKRFINPPVSDSSREVGNLTERKEHPPIYNVKNLSVRHFDLNYLRIGLTELAKKLLHQWQNLKKNP